MIQEYMRINGERLGKDCGMIFWTFFMGGVLGFLIETVWCYFDFGGFSSRTSNLFFPFSIVWAVGAVILLMFFRFAKAPSMQSVFIKGCLVCGIFEFTCGYIGERMLGVTFWDYTELPLHIGRYVNVFICLLWGGLCIIWEKWLYPNWNKKVMKLLKKRSGHIFTVIMLCFMIITNLFSGLALLRMEARRVGRIADSSMDNMLDIYFSDQVLQVYFPKMKYINYDKH